jgi:hypothetical protein
MKFHPVVPGLTFLWIVLSESTKRNRYQWFHTIHAVVWCTSSTSGILQMVSECLKIRLILLYIRQHKPVRTKWESVDRIQPWCLLLLKLMFRLFNRSGQNSDVTKLQTNLKYGHEFWLLKNLEGDKRVESEKFWRWCTTLSITGFLDFVHRPEF